MNIPRPITFISDSQWFEDVVKSFYPNSLTSEERVGCNIVYLMLVVADASQFTRLNQMQDSTFSVATTDEIPGQVFHRLAQISRSELSQYVVLQVSKPALIRDYPCCHWINGTRYISSLELLWP